MEEAVQEVSEATAEIIRMYQAVQDAEDAGKDFEDKVDTSYRRALSNARCLGELLIAEKLNHEGTWTAYVENELPMSISTTRRYINIHNHRNITIDTKSIREATIIVDAYLAKIKREEDKYKADKAYNELYERCRKRKEAKVYGKPFEAFKDATEKKVYERYLQNEPWEFEDQVMYERCEARKEAEDAGTDFEEFKDFREENHYNRFLEGADDEDNDDFWNYYSEDEHDNNPDDIEPDPKPKPKPAPKPFDDDDDEKRAHFTITEEVGLTGKDLVRALFTNTCITDAMRRECAEILAEMMK